MVEHISNSSEAVNSNIIKQQQELHAVDKKAVSKNPYVKVGELTDQSDISNEALKLFERDKEISRYRQMVVDSLSEGNGTKEIAGLVSDGKYTISNDDLAESLMQDQDFISLLSE